MSALQTIYTLPAPPEIMNARERMEIHRSRKHLTPDSNGEMHFTFNENERCILSYYPTAFSPFFPSLQQSPLLASGVNLLWK